MALLEINHLHTCFQTMRGTIPAVRDVSYSLEAGQILGIAGESGSGKSVSAMSILRLLDENGYIDSGEILYRGQNLVTLSDKDMCKIRGNEIAAIFQDPMTSLNPVFPIAKQMREPFIIHQHIGKKAAHQKVLDLLASVQIPDPQSVARQYPYQLSGGMRQRIMIAMALSCQPRLLIADEPTTALDVTIQAQILQLINQLKKNYGTAILLITHDLAVIRQVCDNTAILYCGQIVEKASVPTIFNGGILHPYTKALLHSIPGIDTPIGARLTAIPGAVPPPFDLPVGCKFAPRCPSCTDTCNKEEPELIEINKNHWIRCFYPDSCRSES